MRSKKFVKRYIPTVWKAYSHLHQCVNDHLVVNVPHDPLVAQSTYNVNELRLLDHYEQPRCYVI